MSSYHTSFTYLGKNSKEDFNLIVTHFSDNADSGETDTFLTTSAIYSDSYDGTRQNFYGAKYDTVATPQITVIKQDGTSFGIEDNRKVLRWLTGARQISWMDFYIGDEVKYRLLGRVKSVSQYKMDARVVGLILTFESVSPYGYSALQTITESVNGTKQINIHCDSDELYSYVNMNTIYQNTSGTALTITNNTTGDVTEVTNLSANEVVTISDNMSIISDNTSKTFGNTFNFVFPRLAAGDNEIVINGTGSINFQYIAPVKLGDIAIDINSVSDPICDDEGQIQLDTLPWSRVSNTPTTLGGYGITNAYTKTEVDRLIKNIDTSEIDVYTKSEIDARFNGLSASDIDAYSKAEIDSKLSDITVSSISWDDISDKPNTAAGYGITDVYSVDQVYTKTEVDEILKNLSPGDGIEVNTLSWYKITDTPTSVGGYGIQDAYTKNEVYTKTEVDQIVSEVQVTIDETEFDAMLEEMLS